MTVPRLTQLSHGGGCGCKIAPNLLHEILKGSAQGFISPALLVGIEHADDAAVYQLNAEQALVATTDFFMPMVDDPRDFGRIAAVNAISDVYAMGGSPILALSILGMPVDKLPATTIRSILDGGSEICLRAGIPVAGGHSIDSPEPVYGLTVLGLVHPDHVKTNGGACVGDCLILGKPLGVGILSAAFKQQRLSADDYAELMQWTTTLNRAGPELAQHAGVHAMTDVTGFGLPGHLLEILRATNAEKPLSAQIGARLDFSAIPWLRSAHSFAQENIVTGASHRNWNSYGSCLKPPSEFPLWQRHLLCDPQTSGGLLVSCDPSAASDVLAIFARHGCMRAALIGTIIPAAGTIEIQQD